MEARHDCCATQHTTAGRSRRCACRRGAASLTSDTLVGLEPAASAAHRSPRNVCGSGGDPRASTTCASRTRHRGSGVRRGIALVLFLAVLLDALRDTAASLWQLVGCPHAPVRTPHRLSRSPILFAHATQYELRLVFQLNEYTDGICVSATSNAALSPTAKAAASPVPVAGGSAASAAAIDMTSITPVADTVTLVRINTTTCPYYPLWSIMAGASTASTVPKAGYASVAFNTAIDVGNAQVAEATTAVGAAAAREEGEAAAKREAAASAAAATAASAASASTSASGTVPDPPSTDGLADELRSALHGPRKAVTYYYQNLVTSVFFYLVQGGTITVTIDTDVAPSYASNLLGPYAAHYVLGMSATGSGGTFTTDMYNTPVGTDTRRDASVGASAQSNSNSNSSSSSSDSSSEGPTPAFPYPELALRTAFFFWNQPRLHCLYNAPALMAQMVDSVNQQVAKMQQMKTQHAAAAAAAAPSYPSCAAHMPSPDDLLPPVDTAALLGVPYMQLDSTLMVKIFTYDVWFQLTNGPVPSTWTTAPVADDDSSDGGSSSGGGGSTGGGTTTTTTTSTAYHTVTSGSFTTHFNSAADRGGGSDALNLAADPVRVCAAPALYTISINPLLAQAASWTLGSADGWLQSSASVTHAYQPERVVAVLAQCSGLPMSFSITVNLVNPGSYAGSGQHYDTSIMYILFLVCYALLLVVFLVLIVPCSKRRPRSPTTAAPPQPQPAQPPESSAERDGSAERRSAKSSVEAGSSRDADKHSSSRQSSRPVMGKATGSTKGGGSSSSSSKRKAKGSSSAAAVSGVSAAAAELSTSAHRNTAARIEVSRPLDGAREAQTGAADSEPDTSSLYSVRSSTSSTPSSSGSSSDEDVDANGVVGRAPAAVAAGASTEAAAAATAGEGRTRPRRAARDAAPSPSTVSVTSSSSSWSESASESASSSASRSSDGSSDGDVDDDRRHRQRPHQQPRGGRRSRRNRSARHGEPHATERAGRRGTTRRRDGDAAANRYATDLDEDSEDSESSEGSSLDGASRRTTAHPHRHRHRDDRHRHRDGRRRGSHGYAAAASAQAARAHGAASACFSAARWRGAVRRLRTAITRRVLDPLRLWWKESHILIMYAPVQWIVLSLIVLKCLLCILYAAQFSLLAGMQLDVASIGYSLPLIGYIVEVAASTLLIPTEMLIGMGYGLAYTSPVPTNHIVLVCVATPVMFVVYILCVTCDTSGVNMDLTRNPYTKAANPARCNAFSYLRVALELLCHLHNVLRMMVLVTHLSRTVVPADAAAVQRQRRLRLRQQRRAQREGDAAAAAGGDARSSHSSSRSSSSSSPRDGSGRQHPQHHRSASAHSAFSSASSSSSSLSSSTSSLNSSLNSRTALHLSRGGLLLPANPALTSTGAAGGAVFRLPPITLSPPPRLDYPAVTLSAMEVYLRYRGMWKPFAVLLVWSLLFIALCFLLYEPEDYYMIVAWQEVQTVYLLGFILSFLRTASPFYC